ncbi:MAG TPA: hypothetical protein VGV40_09925 [Solirubrobacteraceae bacterium]|nr:hypothetical protein [Solirubrobacteraceae bacterium]
MDNDHHDDAAPAPQESGEPSEVPAEASQDSVPAAESSPDEAAAADPDRAHVPDPTASAQVPDPADLPGEG